MRATKIAFEKRYSDDSGVEFGVRLVGDKIEFEAVNEIQFPIDEVDWLIEALQRIKSELTEPHTPQGGDTP